MKNPRIVTDGYANVVHREAVARHPGEGAAMKSSLFTPVPSDERRTLRQALRDLLNAEWMVSCDWCHPNDREAVLKQARAALRWRKP
jgi:hypothetical protein